MILYQGKNLVQDKELIEYTKCSLRHLYRFKCRIETEKLSYSELIYKIGKNVILDMLKELSDGSTTTLSTYMEQLSKLIETACTEFKISLDKVVQEIASCKIYLAQFFSEPIYKIIGVRVPYTRSIVVKEEEVVISGTIDVVRVKEYKGDLDEREIELIHLSYEDGILTDIGRENDISIVCSRLGMSTYLEEKGTKKFSAVRAILFSMRNGKSTEIDIGTGDFRYQLPWLFNIAMAIKAGLYYPQFDQTRCNLCPYMKGCTPSIIKPMGKIMRRPVHKGKKLKRKIDREK